MFMLKMVCKQTYERAHFYHLVRGGSNNIKKYYSVNTIYLLIKKIVVIVHTIVLSEEAGA